MVSLWLSIAKKHGVFRVNKKGDLAGDGVTQFGCALEGMNIDIICANTSQAKSMPATPEYASLPYAA